MLKRSHVILLLAMLLALSSCHSSKKTAHAQYGDDIYAAQSSNKGKDKDQKVSLIDRLLAEAYSWTGTPYKSGGHSRKGTDCSGYTMEVYRTVLGVELPRNSAKQIEACEKVKKNKIQPGDLLFFHPSKKGKISHVGIYVGNGKMLHASSRGVMESDITIPYWEKCYNRAGRVKLTDGALSSPSPPEEEEQGPAPQDESSNSKPRDAITSPDWSF